MKFSRFFTENCISRHFNFAVEGKIWISRHFNFVIQEKKCISRHFNFAVTKSWKKKNILFYHKQEIRRSFFSVQLYFLKSIQIVPLWFENIIIVIIIGKKKRKPYNVNEKANKKSRQETDLDQPSSSSSIVVTFFKVLSQNKKERQVR